MKHFIRDEIIEVNMGGLTASPEVSPRWMDAAYRHTNSEGQHYIVPITSDGWRMSPLYVHDRWVRTKRG